MARWLSVAPMGLELQGPWNIFLFYQQLTLLLLECCSRNGGKQAAQYCYPILQMWLGGMECQRGYLQSRSEPTQHFWCCFLCYFFPVHHNTCRRVPWSEPGPPTSSYATVHPGGPPLLYAGRRALGLDVCHHKAEFSVSASFWISHSKADPLALREPWVLSGAACPSPRLITLKHISRSAVH